MSTLSYQRRTKGVNSEMESVQSSYEVSLYFRSEHEWRVASRIYWDRNTGVNVPTILNKERIEHNYYKELMTKYKQFMSHRYVSNK